MSIASPFRLSSRVRSGGVLDVLRRIAPLLSLVMAVLVFGQITDLVQCADEMADMSESGTHHDAPVIQGAHVVPLPGGDHGEQPHHDEGLADCLCHVVFVPTALLPLVPEGVSAAARFVPFRAATPQVAGAARDHVPLA